MHFLSLGSVFDFLVIFCASFEYFCHFLAYFFSFFFSFYVYVSAQYFSRKNNVHWQVVDLALVVATWLMWLKVIYTH